MAKIKVGVSDVRTKQVSLNQEQLKFVTDGLGYVCSNFESLIKKCRAAGQTDASDLIQRQFVIAAGLRDSLMLELD